MTRAFIALLRGVNVSGRNKIPMAELRSLCTSLGWRGVETYIQSGNVVFQAPGASAGLEEELQQAIQRQFDLSIAVVVRAAADWPAYLKSNPYPEESISEPNHVMLALSKSPPSPDAADRLRDRAVSGERIVQVGDAIWIHYGLGVAKSKLSPALFDRFVGSPVTARNWRTVLKLQEMASVKM